MASSSGSPCAACKFLRRKCTSECVFAPYFPPDQPQKFANVHKIFGASNVSKILNELPQHQREDAVNSLAYEAEARVKDPVYGCVGAMSILQRQILLLQKQLIIARAELSKYASGSGIVTMVTPGQQQQQQQGLLGPASLEIGMPSTSPIVREQIIPREQLSIDFNRSDQHLTRENFLEYARMTSAGGGSYDAGTLGAFAGFNPESQFHEQMPLFLQSGQGLGSDGASGSSGGASGSQMRGVSPH